MKDLRDKVKNIRRDFEFGSLSKEDVLDNPFDFLQQWLNAAIEAGLKDPNAFVLSTVNNNQPDSRILLLRDINPEGLHCYTNYTSKKSEDLEANPKVCLNFFWVELDRQVRIHADVEKLSAEESDKYFALRPRATQIGAWASKQSGELESRTHLEERIANLEKEFEGKEVPRPDFWGGYNMKPTYFEFWQGRPSRLHDRIIYTPEGEKWNIKRLYP